ncbi:MAG: NUDIX hydrolase [Patescibacteria group bacterium]|jgi:8-oxo-dGTP diphosphatase
MNKQIQKTTVKGIFCNDGKILFAKDRKGRWELPGGKVEFNETIEETLKRECVEELGFKNIQIGDIVNAWTFSSTVNDIDYHFIVLVYECNTDETMVNPSDEHEEHAWVMLTEIDKLNMRDGYRKSVKKYMELKNSKSIKTI